MITSLSILGTILGKQVWDPILDTPISTPLQFYTPILTTTLRFMVKCVGGIEAGTEAMIPFVRVQYPEWDLSKLYIDRWIDFEPRTTG